MSAPGSRMKRPDPREQELQERVASARARLDARAVDLGTSVDRIVNPIQTLRRVPIAGIAAGLATGVAGGLLLSAIRSRRTRKSRRGYPAGGADSVAGFADDHAVRSVLEPGVAGLLASAVPLLVAWMSRERKQVPPG